MPSIVRSDEVILKGLLAGWPGSGKTTFLASAADVPALSPVVCLSFEGGLLSVAHRGDIYEERLHSMKQVDEVFWKVVNKDKEWAPFKTLLIDSGSELADLCLQEVVGAAFEKSKGNTELARRDSIDDVQLKDYGLSTRRTTRIFRWLRDLDAINVLFSALPKERYPQVPSNASKEEKQRFEANVKLGIIKPMQVVPSFTDKLGTTILGFLDFCFFLNVVDVKDEGQVRQLITAPVGPLKFIKCRNPRAAEVFGKGLQVDYVGGKPTINGKPAMQVVYDGFAAGVR